MEQQTIRRKKRNTEEIHLEILRILLYSEKPMILTKIMCKANLPGRSDYMKNMVHLNYFLDKSFILEKTIRLSASKWKREFRITREGIDFYVDSKIKEQIFRTKREMLPFSSEGI